MQGVSEDVNGENHFLAVNVTLDGKMVSHTNRLSDKTEMLWIYHVRPTTLCMYEQDVVILGILDTGGQTSVLNTAAANALGLTEDTGRV